MSKCAPCPATLAPIPIARYLPPAVVAQLLAADLSAETTVSGKISRYSGVESRLRTCRPKSAERSAVWVTIMMW